MYFKNDTLAFICIVVVATEIHLKYKNLHKSLLPFDFACKPPEHSTFRMIIESLLFSAVVC